MGKTESLLVAENTFGLTGEIYNKAKIAVSKKLFGYDIIGSDYKEYTSTKDNWRKGQKYRTCLYTLKNKKGNKREVLCDNWCDDNKCFGITIWDFSESKFGDIILSE